MNKATKKKSRLTRKTAKNICSNMVFVTIFINIFFNFVDFASTGRQIFLFVVFLAGFFAIVRKKGCFDWKIQHILGVFLVYAGLFWFSADTRFILSFVKSLCLILAYRQMENLDFNLTVTGKSDHRNHASKRLISTNNRLIIASLFGVIAVAAIAVYAPVFLNFAWLATAVIWLVEPLLRVVVYAVSPILNLVERVNPRHGDHDPPAPADPGGWGGVQELLPSEAFAYAVAFVAIALIAAFFLALYFARRSSLKPKTERLEDYETVRLESNVMQDLLGLLPKLPKIRHPIRREYARKVNKHIKRGTEIRDHDTTDIIAKKILPKENIGELTARYEKVRYG